MQDLTDDLERLLGAGWGAGAPPRVLPMKQSDAVRVALVQAGGDSAVIKAFADAAAFGREAQMLAALRGSGLAPELLGYDQPSLRIAMEFIPGRALRQALEGDAPLEACRAVGAWLARFAGRMAGTGRRTDWHAYLSNYPEFGMGRALADRADWLRGLPIARMTVAKNDAFAANFIETPQGRWVGIDFEAARLKPAGWDILLTARSLARDLPGRADQAIAALVEGWGGAEVNLGRGDFMALAQWFAQATKTLE